MLEAKLSAATEPDSVKMPPGYEVVPEVKEGQPSYHLPNELQLPESLGAALAVLEGVSFAALGVHVLEPVIAAQETRLKVVAKPKPPAGKPAGGRPKPSPSPPPKPRSTSRSKSPAVAAKPAAERKPPRARSKSPGKEGEAGGDKAKPGGGLKAALAAQKSSARIALEKPESDNPLRADVRKYQEEQERLKKQAQQDAQRDG